MEKHYSVHDNSYLQEILPLGCWSLHKQRKKSRLQSFFQRFKKEVDTLLAAVAIGLMFLAGIWIFLIELAELSIQP